MQKISNYANVSQFVYTDPSIQTASYNMMNGLFKTSFLLTAKFTESATDLYFAKLNITEAIAIAMSCILGILILFQAPSAYLLAKVVRSQANIFLRLPVATCNKLREQASDFANSIHLNVRSTI